jgi:hypothetical protein
MAKPVSPVLIDSKLLANEQKEDLWPTSKEPWISTILRSWAKYQIDAEGEEVGLDFEGYSTERLQRQGITDFEQPVKQILEYRTEVNGEIEYLVQWVGYPMPMYNAGVRRSHMSGADAHTGYHKAHRVYMSSTIAGVVGASC